MNEFIDEQENTRRGVRSWYEVIELSDEQRASLDEALRNRDIYATTISRVLKKWGHDVSAGKVSWYRSSHGL